MSGELHLSIKDLPTPLPLQEKKEEILEAKQTDKEETVKKDIQKEKKGQKLKGKT